MRLRLPFGGALSVHRRAVAGTLVVCVAALGALALAGCGGSADAGPAGSGPPTASPSATGKVVAHVNGADVTQAAVDLERAQARLEHRDDGTDAARDEAIRRELITQLAARLGVTIDEAAITARLAALEERAGGRESLAAALATARMTSAQLRASVSAALLEEKVAAAKFAGSKASPAAVRAFYERHRKDLFTEPARLRLGDMTLPSRHIGDEVVAKVKAGADFKELARSYSMDEQTKYQGGDLGWISTASLPEELRGAVAGVAAGGVSEPVKSFGRWHVLQVVARKPARVLPFAEVRAAIAQELTRRRRARALEQWLAAARDRATVEVLP